MANKYWVGGSGLWNNSSTTNWSNTSGGAGGAAIPGAADVAIFDDNSGTGTVTLYSTLTAGTGVSMLTDNITLELAENVVLLPAVRSMSFQKGTINLNSYSLSVGIFRADFNNTRTMNFGTGKLVITGSNATVFNLTWGAQLTLTGSKRVELNNAAATGTRVIFGTFTTQGGTENNTPDIYVLNGSDIVSLSTSASGFRTLDFTGFTGTLAASSSNKTIFGDLVISSGMTMYTGLTGLVFAGTTARQITTAGKTFDFPLVFNGVGGTFTFQDALTQGSTRAFTVTNGTVKLKHGVTSTVGAFATSGTTQKFLESTLAGTQATLSQASGTVSASNLTIKDIAATGGATWNAFYSNGNNDAGNNTGWNFGGTPAVSAEVTYRLRSLTTPRRF